MANFNRMTIKENGESFQVFKMKPEHRYSGAVSGGGHRLTTWFVSPIAKPLFSGSYAECLAFISTQGADFMSDHRLPV